MRLSKMEVETEEARAVVGLQWEAFWYLEDTGQWCQIRLRVVSSHTLRGPSGKP